jgi:hypothetical protein
MSSSVQPAGQTTVTFQTSYDPSAPATRVFNLEITSEAQAYYIAQMSTLQHALLDGVATDANGNVVVDSDGNPIKLTDDQIATIVNSVIKTLDSWSQMIYVSSSGSQMTDDAKWSGILSTSSTMTRYMASDLDTLERTLAAAGITPMTLSTPPTSAELSAEEAAIQSIQGDDTSSQPIYGVRSLIGSALKAASVALIIGSSNTQSTSIQQLLMVDYIATGNEVLYGQMTNLQNAINLNQNVLSYLNSLQDLMNQKTPAQFLMQLSNLNSSSPDYTRFEEETFGNQVIGTTAKFTGDQLQRYLALLAAQNSGVDLSTNMIASLAYGFGGPNSDLQRLELFREITTPDSSGRILVPLTATSIPDNAVPGFTPTAFDQTQFQAYCSAVNAGADLTNPGIQLKYGLVDFYTATNEILQANPGMTYQQVLGGTGGVIPLRDNLLFSESENYPDFLTYLESFYVSLYERTKSLMDTYPDLGLEPRIATAIAECSILHDPPPAIDPGTAGTMSLNNLLSGFFDTGDPLPTLPEGLEPILSALQTIHASDLNLEAAYIPLWAGLVTLGLADPEPTTSYGALLGASSVEVLINLQKAGLMNSDGTIPASTITTYGLTAQDQADYALICQIQAAGLDPTDSAVQAQYGLVVRNDNLGANIAAGTSPKAFVDVISGQYNGAGGVDAIIKNLTALIALAKQQIGASASSSLVTELNTVLGDFQDIVSSGSTDPIATWVTNFSNNTEGAYQTNLNNAVVSCQALNDTQRENLQQVMFVYQQFYQSATSMLASLMTLMQTIASNIGSA